MELNNEIPKMSTWETSKPANIHELFKDWTDDSKRDQELNWGNTQGHELPW